MRHLIPMFFLLAGCSSTQQTLSEAPREVIQSDLSQTEAVFCLADRNRVAPLERDDGSQIVSVRAPAGAMVFTVRPEGEGSRIEVRRSGTIVGVRWRNCFE